MSSPTSQQDFTRAPWPANPSPKGRNRRTFHVRRGWIALAVLVAVALTGGGAYLAYENTLPTAVTLNVANGQKDVPADAPLVLSFNRPVSLDTVKAALSVKPATEGSVTSISGQNKYAWSPTKPLSDLTTYTVAFKKVEDATNHPVRSGTWTFTTTIVPRIMSVTATDIGPVVDGAEFGPGASVTFAFNDVMVPSTVKLTSGTQPLNVMWAKDSRSASMSTKGINSGPLVIQLGAGARDVTGHTIKTGWTLVTGLYYRDREHTVALKYPALIQVPNDANAVDQSGLQAADIVFEYLAEGGITRLTAMYGNAPDVIGPMRSSRLVSLKLDRHYRGLLFQSGESQVTESVAGAAPVPQFFDTAGYTFRSGSRIAPDNLMITGDAVKRAETTFFPGIPGYAIPKARPTSLSGGSPALRFSVDEHYSTYSYDPVIGTYLKAEQGHVYADAHTGQLLRAEMVITLHTKVSVLPIGDGHGSFIHDFNLDSGGWADFYYKGLHYRGSWGSNDAHGPLVFAQGNGQPITLPPGLVWIDVTA